MSPHPCLLTSVILPLSSHLCHLACHLTSVFSPLSNISPVLASVHQLELERARARARRVALDPPPSPPPPPPPEERSPPAAPPPAGGEPGLDMEDLVTVEMVSDDETRRDDVSGAGGEGEERMGRDRLGQTGMTRRGMSLWCLSVMRRHWLLACQRLKASRRNYLLGV